MELIGPDGELPTAMEDAIASPPGPAAENDAIETMLHMHEASSLIFAVITTSLYYLFVFGLLLIIMLCLNRGLCLCNSGYLL